MAQNASACPVGATKTREFACKDEIDLVRVLATAHEAFKPYALDMVRVLTLSRAAAHDPDVLRIFARARFGSIGRTLLSISVLLEKPARAAELLSAGAPPQRVTLSDLRAAQTELKMAIDMFNADEYKNRDTDLGDFCLNFDDPACENMSNFYPWDEVDGEQFLSPTKKLLLIARRLGLDISEWADVPRLRDDVEEDAAVDELSADDIWERSLDDLGLSGYQGRKGIIDIARSPFRNLVQSLRKNNTNTGGGGAGSADH